MNNDRELLEQAAKAVGIEKWKWKPTLGGDVFVKWGISDYANYYAGWEEWNPLTDDGDALRLAVKLGIDIRPSMSGNTKFKYAWIDKKSYSDNVNDPYAATRRAIVRAAAEIGKDMK